MRITGSGHSVTAPRHVLAGVAAAVVLCVAFIGLLAPPADAHAELASSDPSADALLRTAPARVTLQFDDTVAVEGASIMVLDASGARVDDGPVVAASPAGDAVTVPLRDGLATGTYLVSWTVTADDTHPVSGSFTFSVGTRSGTVVGTGPQRNDAAGVALGALRWIGYVGLALGPGVLLVALLLWPRGLHERRCRRIVGTGLGLLVLSTVGGMLLEGVWASGAPLSALWQAPDTLDTHSPRFDLVYAWRAFLLVCFAVAMAVSLLSRSVPALSRRLLLGSVGASSIVLLVTWPVVGHSAVGALPAAAIAANLLHSLAMVLWLGGLVLVLASLSARGNESDLVAVLPSFSRLALGCAAVLVATGVAMAWRELGGPAAVTSTEFGHLLLGKLAAVAVLFLLGRASQRWVGRNVTARGHVVPTDGHGTAGGGTILAARVEQAELLDPTAVASFRRGIRAEVVVAMLVLAVTSALVVVGPHS